MRSLKIITLLIASFIGISAASIMPVAAASDLDVNACDQLPSGSKAYKAAGCGSSTDELPKTVKNILTAVIGLGGIIAVGFVISGGVQYMSSNGDAGKVKKAKDTILYAVIGLIVCALSFLIVQFVIGNILK